MFYLVHFDLECKNVSNLMMDIWKPNTSIIFYSKNIYVPSLNNDKLIVWIEPSAIYNHPYLFHNFSKLYGIKQFIPLNIKESIHDPTWIWYDTYVDNVFIDVIKEYDSYTVL